MRMLCLLLAVAVCHALPVPEQKTQIDIDGFCNNLMSVRNNDVSKVNLYEADPQNCHNYYLCHFDVLGKLLQAHYQMCQAGLRWDPLYMTCVWDLPASRGTCDQDVCKNEDVTLKGFYVSDASESCNEYVQCDNGVSVKRCCPHGQMFNVVTVQCEESETCFDTNCVDGNQEPEEELGEEIYEKGQIYTCEQGDYLYTLVTTKSFTRTSMTDNSVESFNCYESAPYFSIRRCSCYSKDELPPVDRTLPNGVTLVENECYRDKFIFTKLGVNRYEGRKADGAATFLEAKDCPADKLIFRLETCCCDVITLADTLLVDQCVVGDKIYQTVDDSHYMIGDVKSRVFDQDTLVCPPAKPVWDFDSCACIEGEPETPFVRPAWMAHCGIFSMDSLSRIGDKYVTNHGPVDLSNHEACFAGTADSYFDIPYYTSNDLGSKLSVALKFKYDLFAPHPYVSLVHNGVDDDQSLDISVDDSHVRVTVAIQGQADKCTLELDNMHIVPRIFPAPLPTYDEVAVIYDGTKASGNLQLRVKTQDRDSIMASVDCPGKLRSTAHPIYVGANFPGCVDELYFCKTIIDPLDQGASIGK